MNASPDLCGRRRTAPCHLNFAAAGPQLSASPSDRARRRRTRIALLVVLAGLGCVVGEGEARAEDSGSNEARTAGVAVPENSPPEGELMSGDSGGEVLGYDELPTAEQLVAGVAALQTKLTTKLAEYEGALAALEKSYRRSPHRPALWRAQTFGQIEAHRAAIQELREFLDPAVRVWELARELEPLLKTQSEEQLVERRRELLEHYSDGDGLIDRQWLLFYDQTPLQLVTQPAGLIWTIETRFDGDNVLVVTGTTPIDEERFVGGGTGTLRISCPGRPDYVEEFHAGLSPWDGVSAEIDFAQLYPAR